LYFYFAIEKQLGDRIFMAENYDNLKDELSGLQKKYSEIEMKNNNLKKRLLEIYLLYQISMTLSRSLNLDEILKSIKRIFQKNFNLDHYGIFLLDDTLSTLTLCSSFGFPKNGHPKAYFAVGEEIFGKSVELEEPIYIPDISLDQKYNFFDGEPKTGCFLAIPILLGKERPLGAISLYRKRINSFSENDITLFNKLGQEIANVIDKILLFQHTKELSNTDDLTGLYNRRYFNQYYEREVLRAKRYRRPLSVLMVDIDHFKNYNDINGHLLGDEILKKVARLLESNLRKADIVARYGGEEFVILLPEIDKTHADQVAEKLRRTIELKSFPKEQYQPNKNITISLGLATLPDDSTNARELVELADRALYRAKAEGRNRVVAYHPSMIQITKNNILHMEPKSVAAAE